VLTLLLAAAGALAGSQIAFYLMWVVVAYLFIMAVYYTVKLM
jgi:hypothetical protein